MERREIPVKIYQQPGKAFYWYGYPWPDDWRFEWADGFIVAKFYTSRVDQWELIECSENLDKSLIDLQLIDLGRQIHDYQIANAPKFKRNRQRRKGEI